ncbi:protein pitchfork [Arapaima gigas]
MVCFTCYFGLLGPKCPWGAVKQRRAARVSRSACGVPVELLAHHYTVSTASFFSREVLRRVAFGGCRQRLVFSIQWAPDRLGNELSPRALPFLGAGCYDNHILGTMVCDTQTRPLSKRGYILAACFRPPTQCQNSPEHRTRWDDFVDCVTALLRERDAPTNEVSGTLGSAAIGWRCRRTLEAARAAHKQRAGVAAPQTQTETEARERDPLSGHRATTQRVAFYTEYRLSL